MLWFFIRHSFSRNSEKIHYELRHLEMDLIDNLKQKRYSYRITIKVITRSKRMITNYLKLAKKYEIKLSIKLYSKIKNQKKVQTPLKERLYRQ